MHLPPKLVDTLESLKKMVESSRKLWDLLFLKCWVMKKSAKGWAKRLWKNSKNA